MNDQKNSPDLPTHCLLLMLVAGYLLWMAYKLPDNVRSGASAMTMETAWSHAAILALGGAAVLGYSLWLWLRNRKKK